MLRYTLEQILQTPGGSTIPAVVLHFTKIWPQKSGTYKQPRNPQQPNWTMQNGTAQIEGPGGQEVQVTFSNMADQSALIGQTVLAQSKSTQHGVRGLSAEDDTYNGQTTRKIKITGTAIIQPWQGEQAHPPTGQPSPTTARPAATQPSSVRNMAQSSSLPQHGPTIGQARVAANKAANLMVLAKQAAKFAAESSAVEMRPEDATTIFIQLARDGYLAAMPTGKLPSRRPAPAAQLPGQPAPEPEPEPDEPAPPTPAAQQSEEPDEDCPF